MNLIGVLQRVSGAIRQIVGHSALALASVLLSGGGAFTLVSAPKTHVAASSRPLTNIIFRANL
jgi:hypothetical protein